MKRFVVKCLSEADVAFILALAFECGWKWFDDPSVLKPAGQKIKNTDTRYLYFGSKGEGLISRRNTVNKSIAPADVLNARSQLTQITNLLKENTVLHVGAVEVEIDDGKAICGCKKYDADFVADMLRISKEIKGLSDAVTFKPNGSVSLYGHDVSEWVLNEISRQLS